MVIEKDEDGFYVAEVPTLRGCYTQGESIEEVLENIKEVIELCLEAEKPISTPTLVGVQKVEVPA